MNNNKKPKKIENYNLNNLPTVEKPAKLKYPIGDFAPGYYSSKCVNCD
jgi:hypothetical protein